mgnify:CR=1 FL=1
MIFQIQESCKERKCECKDHDIPTFRRGNRREWLLEKQFNPNFVYNGIVHFYIDKKGYSKKKPIRLLKQLWKERYKEGFVKMNHVSILPMTISELGKFV